MAAHLNLWFIAPESRHEGQSSITDFQLISQGPGGVDGGSEVAKGHPALALPACSSAGLLEPRTMGLNSSPGKSIGEHWFNVLVLITNLRPCEVLCNGSIDRASMRDTVPTPGPFGNFPRYPKAVLFTRDTGIGESPRGALSCTEH